MKRILFTSLMALSVSACTVTPEPLTTGAIATFANEKLANVTKNQEPVTDSVTLYEAMARALKYNLDFHVEMYDEALAGERLREASLNSLPKLVANAGYTSRNNDSGSKGSSLFPDRSTFNEDVTLSWNILDLGLSKVRAEQAADEVLVAQEKRRKVINRIIEDVRTAYWRAVSADRLLVGMQKLEHRTRRALGNARALQAEGEVSPLTALTYQRELVEIQQRIQRLQKDLALAKMQLAALMNVRPGETYTLAQPKRTSDSTVLSLPAEDMIFAALENRPEIRDVQYKLRINEKESRAALLEMLPGVNLFASANFDSDSYLNNSNWVSFGAKATYNLLNVFKYPQRKRVVAAQGDLLKARSLAVTMAIMTQVHVSRVRYGHARKLYRTAAKHVAIQKGILHQIRASKNEGAVSEQVAIREEMNTLASQVSADIAYADLQNAYANVFASMGIDPYVDDLRANTTVTALAGQLQNLWIERGDRSGLARATRSAAAYRAAGTTENKPVVVSAKTDPVKTGGIAGLFKPRKAKVALAAEPAPQRPAIQARAKRGKGWFGPNTGPTKSKTFTDSR